MATARPSTRSSAATFRFFEVLAGANLKLDSVKLTNGGGASGGGAIDVNSGGTLTLTNSTVSGNSALVGGGIRNNGGTLTVAGQHRQWQHSDHRRGRRPH
jgi:hypothetical protein